MAIKVKKFKKEFVDPRGFISRLVDQDEYSIRSVLYIQRKKGSTGANHYHKKDAHFIYVFSGKVLYKEKDMKKPRSTIQSIILGPGDVVLSKPMFAHSTDFLEDTILFAYTTEKRNSKRYEQDTVRVTLFDEPEKKKK